MNSYGLSRWAYPILFSCLATATACSSTSDAGTSAAGATSGGSTGSNAGNTNSNVAGSVTSAGGSAGGALSQAGAGGTIAQAGAATGGASSGGAAAGSASGGSSAGGASAGASAGGASSGGSGGASTSGFTLTIPGLTANANCTVDNRTACPSFAKDNIGTSIGGSNKSPEFDWTAGPTGTQSYALTMEDLTVIQSGKPFVHWAIWNIPAATLMLPAGLDTTAMPSVPAGSSQKSFQGNGYQGSGKCGNVYEFTLYALTTASYTGSSSSQTAVRDGLATTNAPTAKLRARSAEPGCTP
ncbi:MAG TPA: YbhB/YbcL family Raf kinase inhibitor-like protein [Polyangiaceae bacterium]|nr:YbhB/YbcL family Raf kinase inhibitor-like protein [Polyangiaceae bacterium]